jgi:PAS domain S-box-containing protein
MIWRHLPWELWAPITTTIAAVVTTAILLWRTGRRPVFKALGRVHKALNPIASISEKLGRIEAQLGPNGGKSIWDKLDSMDKRGRLTSARVNALLDSQAGLTWESDLNGQQTRASDALVAMSGRPAAELRGWGWVNAIHWDDRRRISDAWAKAIVEKRVFDERCRLVTPHGRMYHGRLIAKPYSVDGDVVCFMGTVELDEPSPGVPVN